MLPIIHVVTYDLGFKLLLLKYPAVVHHVVSLVHATLWKLLSNLRSSTCSSTQITAYQRTDSLSSVTVYHG